MKEKYGHFINGKYVESKSGKYIDSINPHDASVIAQITEGDSADVEQAIQSSKKAQELWKNMRALERGKILINVGRTLRENIKRLAEIESREMGMPITAVLGSMETAANYLEYYGGLAPSIQGETLPMGPQTHAYTLHEPYGVIGLITPWNAPLNQTTRGLGPALAAGNTIVQKPSEHTSLTALIMAELAVEAGLPAGVWNVVTGYGNDVGDAIVRHPGTNKVSFTGSLRTGQVIGNVAAEKVMPVTLELGGKSPNIIFEDADLEKTIPGVLVGFSANSGQICSAGTRILVQKSIYDTFSEALAKAASTIPIGIDETFPSLGPLANKTQYEKVLDYYGVAKEEGAIALTGGGPVEETKGYYVKPTVYTNVNADMRIYKEEIFGPVGVLIPFETEEEAIQIANDSEYGLAAGIWTQDVSRVHRVASKLQAGQIYVNSYFDSGVEAPFGGYKKSGIGREKGMIAIKNYLQVKSVIVKL